MLKLSGRSNSDSNSDTDRPTFYYDDCCPLCRGYTAVFAGLDLAGRQGFSTIDDAALRDLDFDRARHQIPLRDPGSGKVAYGLDGILGLVADRWRWLGPLVRFPPIRAGLNGFYWMVTYNRRHIVTAPPPARGVDCAPDFHRPAVLAYLALCLVATTVLGIQAGAVAAVLVATVGAVALVAHRHSNWAINRWQAAGHVGSVSLATALAGAATGVVVALTNPLTGAGGWSVALVNLGAGLVGARKLWLRRWMLTSRPAR